MSLPVPVRGTSFTAPGLLIDLTLSDDEEDLRVKPVTRQNDPTSKPAFLPAGIPFSNHGLLLPGTFFDGDNDFSEVKGGGTIKYKPVLHKFERRRLSGPGGVMSARFHPARDYGQLCSNGSGPSRKSTGHQISRSAPLARDIDVQHLVKRRKTDGAPSSQPQAHLESPPILPPESRDSGSRSGVSPVIPRQAGKIHQLNNTKGKRAKQGPLTVVERLTIDEKRVKDLARNRLFKRIQDSMDKYCNTLSSEKQKSIANHVAAKLVADPRLFEAYQRNIWTTQYEIELSHTTQYHVDKAVETDLRETSRGSLESDEEFASASGDTFIYEQPSMDKGRPQHVERQSSSADFTEDEPIFEKYLNEYEPSIPSRRRSQRHYSSSPTTSFSTDLTEGRQSSSLNCKMKVEVGAHEGPERKAAVIWSDEEQDLLAILVKAQRKVENSAELKADPFWRLITSQLADHGYYRGVPSVRGYWHTRGRAKYNFEERTNPRKRLGGVTGGGETNLRLPPRRFVLLEGSEPSSPTPELAFSATTLNRPEPLTHPRRTRPTNGRTSNSTAALRVPKQVQALETDRRKLAIVREVQSLRLAALDRTMQRPYLSSIDRYNIRRGLELMLSGRDQTLGIEELRQLQESVLHVDFCPEEMKLVYEIIRAVKGGTSLSIDDLPQHIMVLMKHQEVNIDLICSLVQTTIKRPGKKLAHCLLEIRSEEAIRAFLEDAAAGSLSSTPHLLGLDLTPLTKQISPNPSISSLLTERETWGMAPFRVGHCKQPFGVEFSNHLEDSIILQSAWTDCCGDISDVTWTSDVGFICGATAHSDYHNMQYNKPGNLLVGSATLNTLKSIPDHRIVRPIVGREVNAENALDSMRQTQDPWLYTSVVSAAHSEVSGYTFTASFDETVKIWKVSGDGSSMVLCGTWEHDGKVNFVKTSEYHERVASASDVSSSAIRVYNFDESSIPGSPYDTYDCDRALAQSQEPRRTDTWAYFPATIAWGKTPSVEMFLLVGYSPRSLTEHENDIPEDRRNSGEICLWNVENGERILISASKCQNVFEVIWHPTQPIFLAATSPSGIFDTQTKTQIRLFGQNEITGTFTQIKVLDCEASDINELTVMPNHSIHCYVTASCTDGNTYVWDTAQGDRAIHVLGHGESLDNPRQDIPREDADTGVKFASWGRTADRFYTGSSDGKVKAWDIRAPKGEAFVRTVLMLSGGVSAGAFSKDFSKLLIGDATGKVHLLGINDKEIEGEERVDSERAVQYHPKQQNHRGFAATLPANAARKIPKVIIPHPEPAPPIGFQFNIDVEQSAADMARAYLEEGQITLLRNRRVGAVQGPNYGETLFYRYDAHEENDGAMPLLPEWQARQQWHVQGEVSKLSLPRLPILTGSSAADHLMNTALDFDFSRLSLETKVELERDRAEYTFDGLFDHESSPQNKIFKHSRSHSRRSTVAV